MAQTIMCDEHPDTPALYLVTKTDDGEVASLCPASMIGFAIAYLAALAPEQLAPPPKPPARTRKPKAAAAELPAAVPDSADSQPAGHAAG